MLLPSGASNTSGDQDKLRNAFKSGALVLLLMGIRTDLKNPRSGGIIGAGVQICRVFSGLFGSTSVLTCGGFSAQEFMSTLQATFIKTVS